jgi:hypothetical protein
MIAIASGVFVVALSGLSPINAPGFAAFSIRKDWTCWLVTGILVSGGSALWNHLLDIVKAAKVQKEAAAGATPVEVPITAVIRSHRQNHSCAVYVVVFPPLLNPPLNEAA